LHLKAPLTPCPNIDSVL